MATTTLDRLNARNASTVVTPAEALDLPIGSQVMVKGRVLTLTDTTRLVGTVPAFATYTGAVIYSPGLRVTLVR